MYHLTFFNVMLSNKIHFYSENQDYRRTIKNLNLEFISTVNLLIIKYFIDNIEIVLQNTLLHNIA